MEEFVVVLTCTKHDPNKNSIMLMIANSKESALNMALEENPLCYECGSKWGATWSGKEVDLASRAE